MKFALLDAFAAVFANTKYEHRRSTTGDVVASYLFEDLLKLQLSPKFAERVATGRVVVNAMNQAIGKDARRGDGTLGESVPGASRAAVAGYSVERGKIAAVEIGVETKILAKAMNKQIDRVITALKAQIADFRQSNPSVITVALIGVNHAPSYLSFEGNREFPTDGKKMKHPIQEAEKAIARLEQEARAAFDEFLFLRFSAANVPPYLFEWVDLSRTRDEYAAALTRIAKAYERRF